MPQQFALPHQHHNHRQSIRPLISLIFRKHFRPSKQCTRSSPLHDVPIEAKVKFKIRTFQKWTYGWNEVFT